MILRMMVVSEMLRWERATVKNIGEMIMKNINQKIASGEIKIKDRRDENGMTVVELEGDINPMDFMAGANSFLPSHRESDSDNLSPAEAFERFGWYDSYDEQDESFDEELEELMRKELLGDLDDMDLEALEDLEYFDDYDDYDGYGEYEEYDDYDDDLEYALDEAYEPYSHRFQGTPFGNIIEEYARAKAENASSREVALFLRGSNGLLS